LNRISSGIFNVWSHLPDGLQKKPLDFQISILLILVCLAGYNISAFNEFDFLYLESPLAMILQFICVSYLMLGSILILVGLFTHHKHNTILSFCRTELWGWRLIFSASSAMFLAEFFFGVYPGITIGCLIWLLQIVTSCMKLLQYYKEKIQEKSIWIA
jgi:hypothetical protein